MYFYKYQKILEDKRVLEKIMDYKDNLNKLTSISIFNKIFG